MPPIALVHAAPGVGVTATSKLVARAVGEQGVAVEHGALGDGSVDWRDVRLAVLLGPVPDPFDRERFLAQVRGVADATDLWNPVDVLRWNTHRSYLLELEERGAPIPPTAWVAAGDRLDLAALMASRGWSDVLIRPAVAATGSSLRVRSTPPPTPGSGSAPVGLAAGQRHLDHLLTAGDALLQPFLAAGATTGRRSVVVVDGQVSHTVRTLPPPATGDPARSLRAAGTDAVAGDGVVHGGVVDGGVDAETAGLARWVVDATGVDLLAARVDLIDDDLGSPQVVEVDAALPELYLDVVPSAATDLATAILRRLG